MTCTNKSRIRRSSPCDSRRSATSALRPPSESVISATSLAIAVPDPMATPTSAAERAGESFTPSPTMTTRAPSARSSSMMPCLSSGSRFARYSAISASAATRAAAWSLSPVSITIRWNPRARRSARAATVSSLTGSSTPITPLSTPSTARYKVESPSIVAAISAAAEGGISTCSSWTTKCSEPITTRAPLSALAIPCATMYSTSAWRSRCLSPASAAAFTTARATGCGKCSSRQAENRSTSSVDHPSNPSTSRTRGAAAVSVPVLSKTMVSAAAKASKYRDPLTMKPSRALWLMAVSTEIAPVSLRAQE